MDEVFHTSDRVPREELRALLVRSDGPGLAHLALLLPLLIGGGLATIHLGAAGSPLWPLAATITGVALLTFFPALHEAGHGTAFRTPWLNDAVTWLAAILMLEGPTFFREFHWEHHRQTQDRARDPEIAAAPALLDPWPSNPLTYLALASGQALLVGKAMFTIGCALMPSAAAWEKVFPYVRPRMRRRVAWECRLVLAFLVGGVWAGLTYVPGFAYLLVAWPIAHVLMGFYLMAEHTGLANEGSQLHRTRTIESNAAVRWLMWNMPYHAEHHAYPAVPFHQVPALHRRLQPALENTVRGYLAFHAEALRRAFGGR
ncbi:MAG: fatty acid desaturase [Myxococcales bacterium]|nr:fatty acid desaturase [Myxococcales bacterium]MCB9567341.1 fatty acid desaturase [Myxococcales bacterium]